MRKLVLFSLAALLFCGPATQAWSFEHYHWHGGHYYREAGWFGLGGFLAGLAVGSYVASLPPSYEIVYVNGVPYYYADGYYYQTAPDGYVVVQPPEGQGAPTGNNPMFMILGILLAIVLLLGIGLLAKRLFAREHSPAGSS